MSELFAMQGRHNVFQTHWYYNDRTPITFFEWTPSQPDEYTLNVSLAIGVNDGFLMASLPIGVNGCF